jgi:SPP1 gp7 family putative phage head morphogenesis protein
MEKTFGEFLRQLFHSVNTIGFKNTLMGVIKATYVQGVEDAEKELKIDIGFTPSMMTEVKTLTDRQLEGFYIEGKRWNGIKGVADDVQQEVSELVRNAMVDRTGLVDLRKQIQERLDITKTRAEAIARTETTRFLNHSTLRSYKESGIVKGVRADAFIDDRTSEICKHLNNKVVKLGEYFTLPDGNQVDGPPFHVNCRTRLVAVLIDE